MSQTTRRGSRGINRRPRLFAEHTGYQALYEHWSNRPQESAQRLRRVFDRKEIASIESPVVWDHDRKLLIDRGNFMDWQRIDETGRCAQYTNQARCHVVCIAMHRIGP